VRDPAGPAHMDFSIGVEATAQVAQELSAIARVLLAPGSPEQTLAHIVRLTSQTIDGCDQCGVCTAGEVQPVQTSPQLRELDDLQSSLGQGPCRDALTGHDTVYIEDLADATGCARWPQFAPAAVLAGMRSVLAYRLFAGGQTLGALQMFSTLPRAFSAHDRTVGLIFAAHAGMALDQAQQHASERERSENLQAALGSREIIGQAQGILMEREKITGEQAFHLLRQSSQHLNRKLRDVAQDLIDTGTTPTLQAPAPPGGSQ
jgi:GAF domain-containing protein